MAVAATLASGSDGPTRRTIVDFVEDVAGDGPDAVPPAERLAVFDNDGTLSTEKPMPIQLHFIVKKWREQAAAEWRFGLTSRWRAEYRATPDAEATTRRIR